MLTCSAVLNIQGQQEQREARLILLLDVGRSRMAVDQRQDLGNSMGARLRILRQFILGDHQYRITKDPGDTRFLGGIRSA